ncbi:YjcZ family sporulation protein [Microaerobacter geothermalis]|nr:YjcZ family sporulation protein [Microaerobacter geothermalis]MCF6093720.1 YjcZ family sporulation protein [Microaerobacter geothermalis]
MVEDNRERGIKMSGIFNDEFTLVLVLFILLVIVGASD